jgi:2-phosphosulfolactate phosphatase
LKIDVIFSASEVELSRVKDKTAVVIDVLRATSVMVTALYNGASSVVPVLTPEEAFAYRAKATNKFILAGERYSEKIDGFDYGNSPLDMRPEIVKDGKLVITTSNGTRAIQNASGAADLFVAAFLNAEATINRLKRCNDVVLICSGTNDCFAMEDTLCAGYLIDLLTADNRLDLSDAALGAFYLYTGVRNNMHAVASQGRHYSLLKHKGLDADLEYCFRKNQLNVVARRYEHFIVAEKF